MKLNYNIKLEQSQKLIMTAELRQAIQLLQFNSIELNEYISNELEENPMLEMENPPKEMETVAIDSKDNDIEWTEYIEKYDDVSYKPEIDRNTKDFNIEDFITQDQSLKDHLISQLNMLELKKKERIIADYIIENLDENGYLIASTDEIMSSTKSSLKNVEGVLSIIHSLEPLGVGARTLKECLLIQINDSHDPIVKQIIENHLEDIAYNRINKIAKENDLSQNDTQRICDFIRTLEPKPGRLFSSDSGETKYIVPDATILLVDDEYIIQVNEYTGPRLNINSFYRNMLMDGGDRNATEFLQDKLNSAMWLIRSIEQRRQTIYKVVESILKHQLEFFKEGDKKLIPLTLKEVADDIGMHESTISRTTNGKYVQTPRGLFELKFFFSSSLSGNTGDISSTSVKSMIKELIDKEDAKKPLSDENISKLLDQRGTKISRRTVAKYRDEMEIPSSTLRKRF
ncbi:RNA polymerase factor sigma-54 [Tissierella creatinini]|nr:RNA polymerase factor sigma-54 [Tissierella creatinini]TJX67527.1 RNA polymerase factor sigma-54 [Soehngenia saccharolytica]